MYPSSGALRYGVGEGYFHPIPKEILSNKEPSHNNQQIDTSYTHITIFGHNKWSIFA